MTLINLKNKHPSILVIGDLILDEYLWGDCSRISPEAPVQIVNVHRENQILGGAGNVVHNLKTLGANVDVISVIGECTTSRQITKLLKNISVKTSYLIQEKGRISSKKSRIIAANQQVVRFDRENSYSISTDSQNSILSTFKKIVTNYDIVLISDYGKGQLNKKLTQNLIEISKNNSKKVLVDPKGKDYSKYKGSFLLTPNIKEASEATNISIIDQKSLLLAISKLKLDCSLDFSLITLSEKGVAVYDKELNIYPTTSREVFDVTGAGDTVLASLGFALGCKLHIDRAVEFANIAAGIAVGKIGSSTVTLDEIIEYNSNLKKYSSSGRIKTQTEIIEITKNLKAKDKKIVFTNGCFDLIHSGHIQYLEEAKSLGDILIIGLNSDNSVKKIKGKGRPINTHEDRALILAALDVVDYVVIFSEENPYKLIEAIRPSILVKGADYEAKDVIGADLVDDVVLVKFIAGKSSTEIIKRINSI